jgi:hypothetical protein
MPAPVRAFYMPFVAILYLPVYLIAQAVRFLFRGVVGLRGGDIHAALHDFAVMLLSLFLHVGLVYALRNRMIQPIDWNAFFRGPRGPPGGPPGPPRGPSPGPDPYAGAGAPSPRCPALRGRGSRPTRGPGRYYAHPYYAQAGYGCGISISLVLIMFLCFTQFVSSRGNEYFCEIDEDYLTDRFNLTGLNTEVSYYQYALDLVTDVFDLDADDDLREQIEKSARHLYGLVHARYIVTTRGLAKMVCLSPYFPRWLKRGGY